MYIFSLQNIEVYIEDRYPSMVYENVSVNDVMKWTNWVHS